jgi:hypothetical protein
MLSLMARLISLKYCLSSIESNSKGSKGRYFTNFSRSLSAIDCVSDRISLFSLVAGTFPSMRIHRPSRCPYFIDIFSSISNYSSKQSSCMLR